MLRPWLARLASFAGYVTVAVAYMWPLPAAPASYLPGPPSGDTGVYVWNLWSFSRELLAGRNPFYTTAIFSATPAIDLSLHNYSVAFGAAAVPLLRFLDIVTVYNLLLLAALVLNAAVGQAIAYRVTGRRAVSWVAGLIFGFSPFVIARTTGHLSLVAVAPLGVFWLCLDSWRRSGRVTHAGAAGATLAWALYTDVYFAVFCALFGALYLAPVVVRGVRRSDRAPRWARVTLNTMLGLAVAVTAGIAATGGGDLELAGVRIGLRTLYTPVLVATVFAVARFFLAWSLRVEAAAHRLGRIAVAGAAALATSAAVLLAPWLVALAGRLAAGASIARPIVWRNAVPGVDLLDLLRLNPSNAVVRAILDAGPVALSEASIERTAALPLVALALVGVAVWRWRVPLPRWWVFFTLAFAILALGPFLMVGGANTHVPGPWALLRYLPVLGGVRSPSRFAALVPMGLTVLFAVSLASLLDRVGKSAPLVLAGVGAVLLLELAPMPRTLYSARVPAIYQIVAHDPRPVSVLHLPFGFRDGTRTIGVFDNARQYHQTRHGKQLLGGYVSRVSRAELGRQRRLRVIRTLLWLSEGHPYRPLPAPVLRLRGEQFVQATSLGYVVVERDLTPLPLLEFAIESFDLEWVASSDGLDLYRPAGAGPPSVGQTALPHARGVTASGLLDGAAPAR